MTNYCTRELVAILCAHEDTSLAISKLSELYTEKHGDGLWKLAPKRTLFLFLSSYPEIFHIDGKNVALNPTHGEFECLFRLKQLLIELTANGPINISLLGSRYKERFGERPSSKSLPTFLAEHPDMFFIVGSNVELVSTYATTRCVTRLTKLLHAWWGVKKVDISTLEDWYSRNFGAGYWKLPGETLKSFLARHSNDFVVDGEQVSLRITEAKCVANLRQLLKSASEKSSEVRSSDLATLYIEKYRNRDWKTLGKDFEAFLKEHPNDFRFTKRDYITLVDRISTVSHNGTNSSEFNDPIPALTRQVDDADGNGDSVSLNGSLRTPTTESSSTRKSSFWDESEVLPAAAKPKPNPVPTVSSHFHPPAPEPWERRPASPAVNVVNFRISDITMPKPENRTRAWRTTVSSETSECDDADAGELRFSDLAPESPFLKHARPPLVPSSDSHVAYGVRAAGPSKDRHHLALDTSWDLDAERGGAAIGIGIGIGNGNGNGNGMGRRKSGLHERLKQSDPASRVEILEGLLELERRKNDLERRRNRDTRDRIAELEHLVVEREQEAEELRDRIDRMEEMMVLEGSMHGLELNVY